MAPIDLSFLHTMICLLPDTPEERLRLGKDALSVRTRDGDLLFDRARIEPVRSYSNERVYNGAVRVVGLLQMDLPHIAPLGFTVHWLGLFAENKDAYYEQLTEAEERREEAAAARMFSVATELPGAKVARRVLVLAQGHWVAELLGVSVTSLQSIEGLHGGLRQMNGRLRNPMVEDRVLQTGISKDELGQMREAQAALHRLIDEGRLAEAAAAGGPSPLLVARAVLWTEMTLVGAAARAELPEERWRLYQAPSLLDLAPRGPERRNPPAPTPTQPTQPTQPTTGTQPTPGAPPVTGSLPGGAQPTSGAQPTMGSTVPAAGTPTGAPPPPGTGPTGPAAPDAGTAHPVAVPPGTPIYATPPGGSGPLPVVLLPDGTLAWGAPTGRIDGPAERPERKPRPRTTRR